MLFLLGRCFRFFRGKHGFEAALFFVIVDKYYWYNTQTLFAKMALNAFSLQILHKAVGKSILRALMSRFLLALRSAMRAYIIDYVLLGITAQGRPTRPPDADYFAYYLVHGHVLLILGWKIGCSIAGRRCMNRRCFSGFF
jgi:hypothetical protein